MVTSMTKCLPGKPTMEEEINLERERKKDVVS